MASTKLVTPVPTAIMSTKILPGTHGAGEEHTSSSTRYQQSSSLSHQGLVAYGLANGCGDVMVVDVSSMQIVQTLSGHHAPVSAVLWQVPSVASRLHHHSPRLYTADTRGCVALWDVAEGVMERSVCIPGARAVHALSLCSRNQLLIVLASDSSSYIFDAFLADSSPMPNASLPSVTKPSSSSVDLRPLSSPTRFVMSPIDHRGTAAVAMSDRVRIMCNVDRIVSRMLPQSDSQHEQWSAWAKDVFLNADGRDDEGGDSDTAVVDVCFSYAVPELLFIATRHWVSLYDWQLRLMVKDQLVWCKSGTEFVSVFSVWNIGLDEEDLPQLFSLTDDGRLCAWYVQEMEAFSTVSCDTRGVRIPSKRVSSACQSDMNTNEFVVSFSDGSIAVWWYIVDERCWSMRGVLEVPVLRPVALCTLWYTELCSAQWGAPLAMSSESLPTEEVTGSIGSASGIAPCSSVRPPRVSGREYGDRTIRQHIAVVGLDSGEIAVLNANFNQAVRKFMAVHAGATKIQLLAPHRDDLFWVATSKPSSSGRHLLQVSLLSARSGLLQYILREPPVFAESHTLASMAVDSTSTFLLLGFSSGAFEVWNIDRRSLLHVHNGNGVSSVTWGFLACHLDLAYGPFQLIVAVTADGGTQFFRAQPDKVVRIKESLPMRVGGNSASVALVVSVGDALVCVDSTFGASVVRGVNESACWAPLVQVPRSTPTAIVACLAPEKQDLFAVAFEDGTFGVWNVKTLKRVGYSGKHITVSPSDAKHLRGAGGGIAWIGEAIVVLTASGSIYVMDCSCESVNASFSSRCLRRPMQSIVFLKPAQSSYLRSKWELNAVVVERDRQLQHSNSSTACGEDAATVRLTDSMTPPPSDRSMVNIPLLRLSNSTFASMECTTPSYLVQNVAGPLPCRGPLGQIITPTLVTIVDELELYGSTMLPLHVERRLAHAISRRSLDGAAFIVSQFCGDCEMQHFWGLVRQCRGTWESSDAKLEFSKSHTLDFVDTSQEDPLSVHSKGNIDIFNCDEHKGVPFGPLRPLFCRDRYSEALAPAHVLQANRHALSQLRCYALSQLKGRANVDDTVVRLAVSRELLALGEYATASEVLIDSNSELDSFASHATLAIAVAAASHPPLSSAFTLTAKRAAAMLLARGDVEGAAEKFSLIGEHYEAALALQSQGYWNVAAMMARLSPMSESCRSELLHRWASHCVQRGDVLAAARMLLVLKSPRQAFVILSECSHLTDVAGLFAVALARQYSLVSDECLHSKIASPFRTSFRGASERRDESGGDLEEPDSSETFGGMLTSLLQEYSSHLESVGNVFCQRLVESVLENLSRQGNPLSMPSEK